MRILLKLVIDCDADAAWRAVHSPRAVAELYGPLMDLSPLDPDGTADRAGSPAATCRCSSRSPASCRWAAS